MTLVRFYLVANALFALASLLVLAVRVASTRLRRPLSYRQQLHLACALIAVALVGPWLMLPSAGTDFMPAMTQVWAATSMQAVTASANEAARAMVSAGTSATILPLDVLTWATACACAIGIVFALVRIARGAWSVRRVLERAHLFRRSGALRILCSDEASVPFSCWAPGACYIVVPSSLILRPQDLRIALHHEAQHHRQGDTWTIYVMEFLRGAFFLNPLMPVLLRQVRGLQEFACDEALIRDRRVVAREYCECLIRVAQGAARMGGAVSCLHMADPGGGSMLARRIAAVLEVRREATDRWRAFAVSGFAIVALLATAVGISNSVQDRRVSLAQAREMAAVAQAGSSFPIVVNEQVLAELNRLLGTPDGRAFLREGLKRMAAHEGLISARLAQHGLPGELLAVPLVESGYRNIPQGPNARHGAGIWMFIRPTAQRFGLTVERDQDERLDVAAETEAAMQMFSALYAEFGDWSLALLAYNAGADLVRRAVRETGVRDAFAAAERGYENDPGYVARVTAAVIVLRNSSQLQL
jgi:beta-lactamase regulating signal transducer with metallopeptidase domain